MSNKEEIKFRSVVILLVCFASLLIMLGFVGQTAMRFRNYKEKREIEFEDARTWTSAVCHDIKTVGSLNMAARCAVYNAVLRRNVWEWAMYDTLSHWNMCGEVGCERYFSGALNDISKVFMISVILLLIITFLVGRRLINSVTRRDDDRHMIPYHMLFQTLDTYRGQSKKRMIENHPE
jgi:putative effector of murein hydrolase LrgA (UPF0299 family)